MHVCWYTKLRTSVCECIERMRFNHIISTTHPCICHPIHARIIYTCSRENTHTHTHTLSRARCIEITLHIRSQRTITRAHTGTNVTHIHDKMHFRMLCLSFIRPTGRPLTSYLAHSLSSTPPAPLPTFNAFYAMALYSNKIASIHYFESIPGYSNTPKCIQ